MSAAKSFGKRNQTVPSGISARPVVTAAPQSQSQSQTPSRPGYAGRIAARIPWFTLALSGVLVARFIQELRSATDYEAAYTPGYFSLLAAGASGRDLVVQHGEWWRLFTASVLHGSLTHLIGNLVTFLIVGFLLEPMIGIGWFSAIYFTGGFAGSVLSTWLNSGDTLSVGASGAIMATLAALFTLSFHAGASRPNLMRRVAAGSLFPALMPAVAPGGAITDVNAHLGGCLAGAGIAFALLIAWNDESEILPGRSVAAIIAGFWLAVTGWAFAASSHTYAAYARPGLDFIPPAEMPKDLDVLKSSSMSLVDKYPKDPRAHLFRGIYLLEQHDVADAEPYFRSAARLGATSPVMTRELLDWNQALLALAVRTQHRGEEARKIVAPLCASKPELDLRTRQTLEITKFC